MIMKETSFFFSICIPAYNRPNELLRLLRSINVSAEYVEIIICEDSSPLRQEIIASVELFKLESNYKLSLILNERNLGYDANLRQCITHANGEYILFMGDDDLMISDGLNKFMMFIMNNRHLGYVLKSHRLVHRNGSVELFRYFSSDMFFEKGQETLSTLFRKSVLISGFCIRREYCLPHLTDVLDGTLLYQLYLLAEVVLKYPSAYFDVPIVYQDENLRGKPLFGSSNAEKELYTPGTITPDNSINFMKGYLKVSHYIDKKYSINFTESLLTDISKYSYPILAIQRSKGISEFIKYVNRLKVELNIHRTFYFYVYFFSLIIFNEKKCNLIIQILKKILNKTPTL